MTKTAVDYKNAELARLNDKQIADEKNKLNKYIADNQLNLDVSKLEEAVRHNQMDEYLTKAGIKSNERLKIASLIENGLLQLWTHALPSGDAVVGGVSKMYSADVANDISWHNKLTVAFEQAVKLPQNHRSGIRYYTRNAEDKSTSDNIIYSTIGDDSPDLNDMYPEGSGGIAVLYYTPVLEHDDDQVEVSELQNAVRRLYVPVRQANSGAVNYYDQSDMMQVVLACSSIAEMINYLVRCLRCVHAIHRDLNTYDAWDTHKLSLMVGSTVNADYWIQNTPIIIEAINSIIRSINSILLPIGFDITKRRQLLNSCIFGHHNLLRSEEYIFIPTLYYVYDEANSTLKATKFVINDSLSSASNIKAMLYKMVQPIINGTVTSIMLGDMNKAYPNQTMVLPEITYEVVSDTTHLYSDDEHVLDSIRNADIAYGPVGASTTDISQYDIKQGINGTLDTFIYQGTVDANGVCALIPPSAAALNGGTYGRMDNTVIEEVKYAGLIKALIAGGYNDYTQSTLKLTFLSSLDVKDDIATDEEIMIGSRFKHRAIVEYSYEDDGENFMIHQRNLKITHTGTELINQVRYYGFTKQGYNTNTLTLIGSQEPYYMLFRNYSTGVEINKAWFINENNSDKLDFCRNSFHYVPCCTYYRATIKNDLTDVTTFGDMLNSFDASSVPEKFGRTNYNRINLGAVEFKYLNIASFGSLIMPQAGSETTSTVNTTNSGDGGKSKNRSSRGGRGEEDAK